MDICLYIKRECYMKFTKDVIGGYRMIKEVAYIDFRIYILLSMSYHEVVIIEGLSSHLSCTLERRLSAFPREQIQNLLAFRIWVMKGTPSVS